MVRRQDKASKEQNKPKEKAPVKPSPVRDKEKLRQEIREKFRAAFGHEKI